jgi:acid phosphatase type 7
MRGFVSVIAIGLAACAMNQEGNLGATKMGDLTHPAQRGSPIDAIRSACGQGTMTAAGAAVIRREPYLQQVTTTSAMIGWVTTSPDGEHVNLTTVAGAPVSSAVARVEEGLQRNAGEKQMWATVTGLTPDTIYCYVLENGTLLSDRTGFKTAPAPSASPVRFLAFGDSGGGGNDQHMLRDQMFKFSYDLIVHTGDIAYDEGTIDQFEDNVFGVYAELFRNLPIFPAAGNHEYKTLQGAPFRGVFAIPGDSGEKWYSYDWGNVHFAALDTEASYATQAAWLDHDLATSQLPWKIVYLHRPPYSSGTHGSDASLREALAPVLKKHGVQLVLAGHDHNYERMHPQDGVAYVVTGGGGKGTREVGTSSFTAFSEAVIHFVYVEVNAEELVLHAIDATGVEFDSMVVPRVPS